jgi:hypothetical protein
MARRPTKTTQDDGAPAAQTNTVSTTRPSAFNHHGWLTGLLIAIVVLLIFMAGMAVSNHRNGVVFGPSKAIRTQAGGFGPRHSGGFGGRTADNGQTRAAGVVTSVDGSSFTLAGNGSTTNVTTSGSTQYKDGNQVKQNDSVIVWGTESNGIISAAQIVINP